MSEPYKDISRRCPFCGEIPWTYEGKRTKEINVYCNNKSYKGQPGIECPLAGRSFGVEEWSYRPHEDALRADNARLTAERDATSEDNRMLSERVQRLVDANKSLTAELAEARERFEVTDDLLNHATVTIGAVIACCTYNSNEDAKIGIYGISPDAFTRIDQFITNYNRAVSAGKVSVDVKTVISEGSEPSQSDVSVTQDVLMDIEKDDTCPECGGCGEVAGAYYSGDGVTTCDRCNGKGTI